MNFFAAQEKARRQTFWLIVIFVLMVSVLSFLNAALVGFSFKNWTSHFWPLFMLSSFFFVSAAWIQYLKIRNGPQIAELMGGQALILPTNNALEKRLYNIVEEMSIASGVPIPRVYILRGEMGINAFVAGVNSYSVVLAVTEGALKSLNRDELQSVIGHEFSHILNEDVSLNVKLAGIVTGFYMFVRIGEFLSRGSGRSRNKDAANIGLIGIGFMALGFLGYLFGQILQSMISRQREFLADASSAQFTRNPESLASALAKIQNGPGSELESGYKHEMSHFFFAQGVSGFWSRLFATHPPISERIHLLAPNFKLETFEFDVSTQAADRSNLGMMGFALQDLNSETVSEISNHQINSLEDAKAHLFAVLLSQQNPDVQEKILNHLRENSPSQLAEVESLINDLKLKKENIFKTFKLAIGFLNHGTKSEKNDLLDSMKSLFEMDQVIDFKEGLFYIIAETSLNETFKKAAIIKDFREIENVLKRWVPWILSQASLKNKESVKSLALSQLGLLISFDQGLKSFSWAKLSEDVNLLSRLDPSLRKKLSFFLKKIIQAQGLDSKSMNDEFLLLSWALQVPVSFFAP